MTLTVDELRLHITSDLGDVALGLLLDAAYEAIDLFAGIGGSESYPASLSEVISPGPGDLFMLSRPATSITSIVECDVALAQDDYELINAQMVRRLSDGTNPASRWRGRVIPTYAPLSDIWERDRVAIALVKLDEAHTPGVVSERLGDWSETHETGADADYASQRAAILASLNSSFIAV